MALLEIRGLSKSFGGLHAINGLDIDVDEGEVVSVIGPNGAGKTTFFNLVTGMETPDEGSIVFDGQELVGLRPNQILQLGMARTFQNVRLFPAMTVLENVQGGQHARTRAGLLGAIFKTPGQRREEREIEERAKEVLAFFGTRLSGYRHDQLSMVLSYANRRRLEIARAMATNPRLLLLDERPQPRDHLIGVVSEHPVGTAQKRQPRDAQHPSSGQRLRLANAPSLLARQVFQPQFPRGQVDGGDTVAPSHVQTDCPAATDGLVIGVWGHDQDVHHRTPLFATRL